MDTTTIKLKDGWMVKRKIKKMTFIEKEYAIEYLEAERFIKINEHSFYETWYNGESEAFLLRCNNKRLNKHHNPVDVVITTYCLWNDQVKRENSDIVRNRHRLRRFMKKNQIHQILVASSDEIIREYYNMDEKHIPVLTSFCNLVPFYNNDELSIHAYAFKELPNVRKDLHESSSKYFINTID